MGVCEMYELLIVGVGLTVILILRKVYWDKQLAIWKRLLDSADKGDTSGVRDLLRDRLPAFEQRLLDGVRRDDQPSSLNEASAFLQFFVDIIDDCLDEKGLMKARAFILMQLFMVSDGGRFDGGFKSFLRSVRAGKDVKTTFTVASMEDYIQGHNPYSDQMIHAIKDLEEIVGETETFKIIAWSIMAYQSTRRVGE